MQNKDGQRGKIMQYLIGVLIPHDVAGFILDSICNVIPDPSQIYHAAEISHSAMCEICKYYRPFSPSTTKTALPFPGLLTTTADSF